MRTTWASTRNTNKVTIQAGIRNNDRHSSNLGTFVICYHVAGIRVITSALVQNCLYLIYLHQVDQ